MPVALLGPSRRAILPDSGVPQGKQVSKGLVGVGRDRDRGVGIAQGGGCSVPVALLGQSRRAVSSVKVCPSLFTGMGSRGFKYPWGRLTYSSLVYSILHLLSQAVFRKATRS